MKYLISFFVKKRMLGNLISVFLVVVGLASMLMIQRETFPNVKFDVITINTVFPGASPEEIEKLVVSPLERDLLEVDGIKKVTSSSVENRGYIVLFLDPDQTTEDEAKDDVQDVVDKFDKPEGAEDPEVTSLESKQSPIVEVSISGDLSDLELRSLAKDFERELESVSGVARVVHSGLRDLEVHVEADPKKMARYRVGLDDLVNALRTTNITVPGGTIEPPTSSTTPERIVRTVGDFNSLEDVKNTVIRANELGRAFYIKDVATVKYALEKESNINRTNGKKSLSLTVLKKEKSDAIRLVEDVRARALAYKERINAPVDVSFINDFSSYIKNRISILSTNLLVGLCLIFLTLAFFLPFRVAIIATVGVILSFLGTMLIFYTQGFSINLISLLGLIIVSGMLVDDAVVVSDNIVRKMDGGMDVEDAAIEGTYQIWSSVLASVLTTVIAFLPMFFMSGIFGKFVREVPLGVVTALLFSLFEAFFILPQHVADYVRPAHLRVRANNFLTRLKDRFQAYWDNTVVPAYLRTLEKAIRRRYVVLSGVLGLFIATMILASTTMKFILFPPEGIEIFFVRLKTPSGTSIQKTSELLRPIEQIVAQIPDEELVDFVTNVGIQQQDPNDPETKRGSEFAQIAVYLSPETERERTALDIIEDLRAKIGTPKEFEVVSFDRVNSGPPVGKAISVGVRGKEFDEILPAVNYLKEEIKKIKGVIDITDSYDEGKEEIHVKVNQALAASADLSVATVGTTVRAAYDGLVATTIKELDEEIDVRVMFPKSSRASPESLDDIYIPNMRGNLIPLDSISTTEKKKGILSISHEANQREVRIFGGVNTDVTSANEANAKIKDMIPELNKKFPQVSLYFGGEDEDTQESLQSLIRSFAVAFFGIFLILILTFQRILQPVLVIITIPLGIMSVIWAFMLHGLPLSFMGMLGIIALGGVVVNNAIVLIDFVNQARAEGMEKLESILNAAKLRIRPIFLTTATTVAGLLPTAYGIGGLDRFVVPIAMALGWGLAFGSLLTSFVFPAAIAVLDDVQSFFEKLINKRKTSQS